MPLRGLALLALAGCGSEPGIRVELPPFNAGNVRPVPPVEQVDQIVQVTIPVADVLFVVDNSCSMDAEQVALGSNFPAFLQWFLVSGLDYHIGVVSTDMKDPEHTGRLQLGGGERWVQEDTPLPELAFAEMVSLGVEGDFIEKGRAAAYTAIELLGDTDNAGFVREGSGLHITVVSDENDASGSSPISRAEFVDYLQNLRFGAGNVSFSSIVGPVAGCPEVLTPGTEYMAVTAQVGGVVWPICEPEWTQILDELGFIAVGLSREFFLTQIPVPETIEVSVVTEGARRSFEPADWIYSPSRNSISFVEFLPDPLAEVSIRYDVLASRSKNAN